jgi:hypothetical protein
MAEQISLMPEAQSSFLASLPEIQENQVITGFDSLAPAQFCTPSFLGCRLCIGANVVSGGVALSVSANTPFGSVSKSFKISGNISFTWNPFGLFKVEFKVSNWRKTSSSIRFTISVKVCIKVPILGWKCKSFSNTFSIPIAFSSAQQALFAAPSGTGDDDDDADIDAQGADYKTLLLMHALLEEKGGCNCEKNEE